MLQDTWIVGPDKAIEVSFRAMSAIAGHLKKEKLGLLARFLPRINGDIMIGFLTPLLKAGNESCLVMNILPFEADLRTASFTAFSQKEDLLPSTDQTAAAEGLIKAFMLIQGDARTQSRKQSYEEYDELESHSVLYEHLFFESF